MKITESMTKITLLTILIAGVFIVGTLATNEAFAAVDMFIKIDGVEGESTAKGHKGEIDVLSWSWGETRDTSTTDPGDSTGTVKINDLTFTTELNKSSPKLMQFCANGNHIPEITLFLKREGQKEDYLKIKMENVIISSYNTGGSSGDVPVDEVSLNFSKITFEYKPQSKAGSDEPPVTGTAEKHGRV